MHDDVDARNVQSARDRRDCGRIIIIFYFDIVLRSIELERLRCKLIGTRAGLSHHTGTNCLYGYLL